MNCYFPKKEKNQSPFLFSPSLHFLSLLFLNYQTKRKPGMTRLSVVRVSSITAQVSPIHFATFSKRLARSSAHEEEVVGEEREVRRERGSFKESSSASQALISTSFASFSSSLMDFRLSSIWLTRNYGQKNKKENQISQ